MMDNLLFVLTLSSALGCGLIAGVFFAFSAFVMRALARLEPAQGMAAMQSHRTGERRRRKRMDQLPCQVDGLEPRANGRGHPGGSITHARALLTDPRRTGRPCGTLFSSR